MEPNIWSRIFLFIKESYTKRLKETFGGFILAGFGFHNLFFGHVDTALIQTWIGIWLWIKTILSAYLASLATSLASQHAEAWRTNREKKSHIRKRKDNKAA